MRIWTRRTATHPKRHRFGYSLSIPHRCSQIREQLDPPHAAQRTPKRHRFGYSLSIPQPCSQIRENLDSVGPRAAVVNCVDIRKSPPRKTVPLDWETPDGLYPPSMKGHLPRLPPLAYRGTAYVFWTFTTNQRERFHDLPAFHRSLRELLLHSCARYGLVTPVYVLMPDHLHLLWVGYRDASDQRLAARFLRRESQPYMAPVTWQLQAYDHVVTELERKRQSYADTVHYMLQNPVRAGLCEGWQAYPYLGAIVPGYPNLELRDPSFRERFWRIYRKLCTPRD